MSAGAANSSGWWLSPARQRTKSIAIGASERQTTASWPAPLTKRAARLARRARSGKPRGSAASSRRPHVVLGRLPGERKPAAAGDPAGRGEEVTAGPRRREASRGWRRSSDRVASAGITLAAPGAAETRSHRGDQAAACRGRDPRPPGSIRRPPPGRPGAGPSASCRRARRGPGKVQPSPRLAGDRRNDPDARVPPRGPGPARCGPRHSRAGPAPRMGSGSGEAPRGGPAQAYSASPTVTPARREARDRLAAARRRSPCCRDRRWRSAPPPPPKSPGPRLRRAARRPAAAVRSRAEIGSRTPSAPSKRPASRTVSRWEPSRRVGVPAGPLACGRSGCPRRRPRARPSRPACIQPPDQGVRPAASPATGRSGSGVPARR